MIDKDRAREIISAFSAQNILVLGDLMLDRYVSGSVSRISPEAPVPVVHVREEHSSPGGAANVALNIQALGGRAIVAGIIGKDNPGDNLIKLLSTDSISTEGVIVYDKICTTVKTRILAERQQVVRVDREQPMNITPEISHKLCSRISDLADNLTGVIIEDYGKGVIFQESVNTLLSLAYKADIISGFDPKDNCELNISGLTIATPNYVEACLATGRDEFILNSPMSARISAGTIKPKKDQYDKFSRKLLKEIGDELLRKWNLELLIITLGPHGMYLMSKNEEPEIIPTKAMEVFDVSGAGDTVIATALLSLAAGANRNEAASLANYAAGVVVGKIGTAACSIDELLSAISKS